MTASDEWTPLGAHSPGELTSARIELHWAAQVLGAAADALLPHAEDDSHTNLYWSREHGGVVGKPLPGGHRLGLAFADLALLSIAGDAVEARHALAGKTLADALEWARAELDSSSELSARDYDMPEHPNASSGVRFASPDARFVELGRHFESATAVLGDLARGDDRATSVAIWPHHFDLGGILFLETGASAPEAKQIGFGLSPGDGRIAEPYYYVTPWPIARDADLPPLEAGGHWHTEGFTGALLLASHLVDVEPQQQRGRVERYLRSAIGASEALIAAA